MSLDHAAPSAPLAPEPADIARVYDWLGHGAHGCTELRAIVVSARRVAPLIGAYTDRTAFVRDCLGASRQGYNVYSGVNPRPVRLAESRPNQLLKGIPGGKQGDIDVVSALMLDIDAHHPKEHPASDA